MRGAAIKTKGEERETSETTRAGDDAGGFWSVSANKASEHTPYKVCSGRSNESEGGRRG